MDIKTVKTKSSTIDYIKFGQGDNILVILPGLSAKSIMIFAQGIANAYKKFANYYTIYVFDRKKEFPSSYSISDIATDMIGVFEALGLNSINLLGVSQGGMIAMKIATTKPQLIRKLVLCSTAACTKGNFSIVESWIDLAKENKKEELFLKFSEDVFPHDVFIKSRDIFIDGARTLTDNELNRFIILAEGMKNFDVTEDLPKIESPILILGSVDDKVFNKDSSKQIYDCFNNRKDVFLSLYDGYGHAAYDYAPNYKEEILSFLLGG